MSNNLMRFMFALTLMAWGQAHAGLVVENTSEASPGAGGNPMMGMSFTTGAVASTFESIIAPLGEINFQGDVTVTGRLYTDAAGVPGTLLTNGDLTQHAVSGFALTDYSFAPQSGTVNLLALTTYWFTLETAGGTIGLNWSSTGSTNQTSSVGWTIGDQRAYYDTGMGAWQNSPTIHQFEVYATLDGASGGQAPLPGVLWLLAAGVIMLRQRLG